MTRRKIVPVVLLVALLLALALGVPRRAHAQSEPFIGQIAMFAGNFAPRGWAFCDGQLLSIAENSALFSLLGTTYGGDGRTTFGLPDLRGRFPLHPGNGPGLTPRSLGEKGGVESVTLAANQMPSHTHTNQALAQTTAGTDSDPTGKVPAAGRNFYADIAAGPTTVLASQTSGSTGGGQAHTNVPPFQGVNFIIALIGIYPSRN